MLWSILTPLIVVAVFALAFLIVAYVVRLGAQERNEEWASARTSDAVSSEQQRQIPAA